MNIQLISVIFLLQFLTKVTSKNEFDLNTVPMEEDEKEVDQTNPSPALPNGQGQNEGPQRQMVEGLVSVEPLGQSESSEYSHFPMATAHQTNPHGILKPTPSKTYKILALKEISDPQQPGGIGPIRIGDASKGKQKQTEILGVGKSQLNDGKATSDRFHPYPVARYRKTIQTQRLEGKLILVCSN
jgi:hypothetical protein